jgi:hypothetical protein
MVSRSKPKVWAKVADRPWSVTESLGASDKRALRVSRCSQERRQCARRARVKTFLGGAVTEEGWVELARHTVWLRTTFSHSRRLPQHWSTRQWHGCVGGRGGNSRGRGGERPIYCTHPSRFDRDTVFLTLSTQRAAATMTDTSSVQDPQGTISLRTPFLWIERVISRTTQCPISLRGKSGARKAMGKGRTCPLGRAISDWKRLLLLRMGRLKGRHLRCWSKFGGAQI